LLNYRASDASRGVLKDVVKPATPGNANAPAAEPGR